MAKLILGIGTSHTPMLNTKSDQWGNFLERDRKGRFLDHNGDPASFEELLERAPQEAAPWIEPERLERSFHEAQAHVARIRKTISDARLDCLIVVGDDQNELYHSDNLPGILVYYGETIRNVPRHLAKPNPMPWFQDARAGYYESEGERDFPVHAPLARHLIASLVDDEFDIATSSHLPDGEGEGHAFAFVHKRLMDDFVTPIIPLALNTYYPPNQPTPHRCYRLGQAIARAVESFEGDLRVGILASGGLSHFAVDETLDRDLIQAMQDKDADALCGINRAKLNSGSSEIRNWICAAGALEHLDLSWCEYIPGYRTAAGTGTGLCFAEWQ